jgi:hypothetical protein
MQSKAMAKVITDDIINCKWKEKEERRPKRAIKALIVVEHATPRSIEKWKRVMFMQTWSPIAIKDVKD